ncbi:MAG: hypothetical protein ACOX3S_05260 [Anaerolineae bacterium]|jgi:hypothetical protein
MPFWPEGQPIEVELDADGAVQSFRWQRQEHRVRWVSVQWRVHLAWWTEHEVWRDYCEVVTETRLLCSIYQDRLTLAWRLERVYE